jgi:hypothetical protein
MTGDHVVGVAGLKRSSPIRPRSARSTSAPRL